MARIDPGVCNPYLVERGLFVHLLRIVPCLTDHVNKVTLGHFGRTTVPELLLVDAAVGLDTRLNEANLDGLAGDAETMDHESKNMAV